MKTKLKVMRIVIIIMSLLLAGGATYFGITFFTSRVEKYEVEFVTYTDQGLSALKVEKNKLITHLDAPTRPGYTFTGWYLDQGLKEKFDKELHLVTENFKLYAGWQINKYYILFETNGGSAISSYQIYEGETISNIDKITTKDGYTFDGWYEDNNFDQPFSSITVTGHVTLYARWNSGQALVTYDSAGGSIVESELILSDTTVEQLPIPDREGYNFLGWYLMEDLNTLYLNNVLINDNFNFIAKWEKIKYKVTFRTNLSTQTVPSINLEYLEEIMVDPLFEPGYTFGGWYLDQALTRPFLNGQIIRNNITLYAKWERTVYKVLFNTNGGNAINPIDVPEGETIANLVNPTKEGYSFLGWFEDENLLSPFSKNTIINNPLTLFAKWEINTYVLRYDNGTFTTDFNIVYNNNIPTVPNPTKTGYTFAGWYVNNQIFNLTKMPAKNLDVVAKWDINVYQIVFNTLEGNPIPSSETKTHGEIFKRDEPSSRKAGYTLEGWYLDIDDPTTKWDFSEEHIVTSNITLYAMWLPNERNIQYYIDESTFYDFITFHYQEKITNLIPTKEGYRFVGWYEDGVLFELENMPDRNIKLYARWQINSFEIIFDNANEDNLTYEYQAIISDLPIPTKSGFNFGGWYLDSDYTQPFDLIKMPSNDVLVYANWLIKNNTIGFETNGGNLIEAITGEAGDPILAPDDPVKKGHKFMGWFTDPQLTVPYVFTTIPEEGIFLYAKWEKLSYEINFESYSFDYVADLIVLYGDIIPELSSPIKEGYIFAGWYLDETLKNRFNLEYMPDYNITLYARWEITFFKIAFEATYRIPTIVSEFGGVVSPPESPTKEGYTFIGWYEDFQLTNKFEFTTMPDYHVFLYAKWEINTYVLAFNVDGGSLIAPLKFDYEEAISFNVVTLKEGYSFAGWYLDNDYTHEFDLTKMPASDVILYARWQINRYVVTYVGQTTTTQSLNFNTKITYTPPARQGYTFVGWFVDENLTVLAPTHVPATPITLYAKWQINQYTITFNSNGGTVFDPVTEDYNKLFTPPTPIRAGYTFGGWYSDNKFNNEYTAVRIPAQNITIYAKWNINTYKMSFVTEGPVLADILYDYNATIAAIPTITKVGYTFKGWYLDNNYNTVFNLTKMPAYDVRVYAKWEINQYTISFNSNGGSNVSSITKDFDLPLTEPTKPTKTGYTFKGWYIDQNFNEGYSFIKMPANNLTLYAKWEINTYKLSFISDGPALADIIYDYNQTILALPNISKTGHTFKGWYLDSNYQIAFNLTKMPANNVTVYGKLEINQYTITFNSNGGSNVPNITQDFGTVVVEPTKPIKAGYTFKGWFSDPQFNQGYNFILMPANNLTVYAKWEINQYTISFNSNAGILIQDKTYQYNDYIEALPILDVYGNEFLGWYTPDNIRFEVLDNHSYQITSNISLSAKWKTGVFTISFNSNGGTAVESIVGEFNVVVMEPANPTKDKYQFLGWFKDEALTESYSFSRMTGEDVLLYAKWNRVAPITLTYIRNDGKPNEIVTYQTNQIGSEINYLEIAKTGYSFNGWYQDEALNLPALNNLPDCDLVVYAKWTINRYTISLNLDGGVGVLSINGVYDSDVSEPLQPTKTGHTFIGWYQDVEKTILYEFNKMPAEDITVYAKWQINQFTINFNSNGGSAVNSITKDYNTPITKPANPTMTGYTFKGWFTDEGLTKAYTFKNMPAYDQVLYAKWEIGTYKIKFVTAGPAIADISYKYEAEIAPLPTTTRSGYTFAGWFMDNKYTTEFNLTHMPGENVSVYAKWEINQYTITFNSNGGSSVDSITEDFNTIINAPTTPTKDGYSFVGWFINNQKYVFNKMEAKNITLVARWNQVPALDFVTANNNYFLLEGEGVVLRVKASDDDLNRVVMEFSVETKKYFIYLLPNPNTPLSTTLNGISASFDNESLEWLIILSGEAINNYFVDKEVNLKVKIEDEFGHPFVDLLRTFTFDVTNAAEIISTTPAGNVNVSLADNFKYEIEVKGDDLQMIRIDTNFLGKINAFADPTNPYGSTANQNRLNSQGISLTYQTNPVTKISKLIVEFSQDVTYYLSTLDELVITAKVEDIIGNETEVTTNYHLIYS